MSDSYPRGLPRKPTKKPCENGLIDDGKNCLEKKACKRKTCIKNKTGCLKCGSSIIKVKEEDRYYCDQNEEKVGKLCYKLCKEGYVPKGSLCVKGIPKNLKKSLDHKRKGYIPTVFNSIKRTFLTLLGRKVENFENIEDVNFIKELDIFLKNFLGKDLEEYRWHIFVIVIISTIIIIDYNPEK